MSGRSRTSGLVITNDNRPPSARRVGRARGGGRPCRALPLSYAHHKNHFQTKSGKVWRAMALLPSSLPDFRPAGDTRSVSLKDRGNAHAAGEHPLRCCLRTVIVTITHGLRPDRKSQVNECSSVCQSPGKERLRGPLAEASVGVEPIVIQITRRLRPEQIIDS